MNPIEKVESFLRKDDERIARKIKGKVIEAKSKTDLILIVGSLETISDQTKDPYIKELIRRLFEWDTLK